MAQKKKNQKRKSSLHYTTGLTNPQGFQDATTAGYSSQRDENSGLLASGSKYTAPPPDTETVSEHLN